MIDTLKFQSLLKDYFLPMFSGELGISVPSTPSHRLVAYQNPCTLLLKPGTDADYRVQLTRSQPFSPEEKDLVQIFMDALSSILAQVDQTYFLDVVGTLPRRVISELLSKPTGRNTLAQALQKFEALAAETYEGHPVVLALGLTGSVSHGPISLDDLWAEDFSRVLSNGFDSMYVCGSDAQVFNLLYLPHSDGACFAPHRLGAIAGWCDRPNRVAIVLNRNGEVLAFKDKKLQFAKRRGAWKYYTHEAIVQRLHSGNAALRRSVYETCLDVSFARSGGCIAVLAASTAKASLNDAVDHGDLIENKARTRTKLLSKAVTKKFQNLDRRFRQELLSLDGATILDHSGKILTAGSIVKVPGGSSGGGRKAAALELSKLGLAIKISADGPITGYRQAKSIFSL